MAFVSVQYLVEGTPFYRERRESEPECGEIVRIGLRDFAVRAVFIPDYWTPAGDINQYRIATVVLGAPTLETEQ